MRRLIDANELQIRLAKLGAEPDYQHPGEDWGVGVSMADTIVWEMPTVDAVEVVHWRWCRDGDWLVCLNCESEINVKNSLGIENRKNYCPNCGAKMDGDGNG